MTMMPIVICALGRIKKRLEELEELEFGGKIQTSTDLLKSAKTQEIWRDLKSQDFRNPVC